MVQLLGERACGKSGGGSFEIETNDQLLMVADIASGKSGGGSFEIETYDLDCSASIKLYQWQERWWLI